MKITKSHGKFHTCINIIFVFGLLFTLLGSPRVPAAQALGTQNANTFINCAAQTQIPEAECDALLAFYDGTNGANWTNHTGWLQTDTPCGWYGITCTASTITELELSSNNLVGTIPTQLGKLTNLTRVNLFLNQLGGSIPPEIGNLTKLTYFELRANHLSGPIPKELGKLTNLTELALDDNQLSGSIPAELGNLSNLQVLYLGLPHAISIDPETHPTGYLSNQLSGAIPPELGNLANLRLLALSDNQLSGTIPSELGKLTNLDTLALENNQLSGAIPPELGNLTKLEMLALEGNQLSGAIPPELGNLVHLGILALSNNQLSGTIPPELGNLVSLFYLVLNNNQLNGAIPPKLGALSSLELLILSDNRLSGPIPPELGNLTGLAWLYLDSNSISGEFPTSITNLTNLEIFTFDCWISSTNLNVIAFIDTLVPGWQNSICPVVSSITRSYPNPTNLPSVNFTVTFSELVTDVDAGDFELTTGVTGAFVASVEGTGSTRTVTVSTGAGIGTLRLDAIDNDSIVDSQGNSLGGVGAENGSYRSGESYTLLANTKVFIGGAERGNYHVGLQGSTRQSFPGVNNGPVQVMNITNTPMIASERVIYKLNNISTSFTELMALPNSQLDNIYYLPWYNNKDLDTQLRIANVSGSQATITVTIGGAPQPSFNLAAGASTRVSYPVNNGPVKIVSTQNIVAAGRVIYKVNNINTSFSEMMALPAGQLNTTYWLPWYNNVDLDTQLRIANVSGSQATVTVTIGGVAQPSFTLPAGASTRVSYPVNNGPVKIQSTQNIVAAERVIYKVNNVNTSFSEMMALPAGQLNTTYWLPWYNNVDLDTQLRIANVSGSPATITVTIGGAPRPSFNLAAEASTRISYPANNGPVKIVSTQNIVTAERVIYKVRGVPTSFSEMMGLPNGQLDLTYWLPWYNNVDLDTQLRFGVP